MAWASAVRCWSAASTSTGHRSRPDSPAVPACSVNDSTRASFSACSLRRRAAAGSAEMTSRRARARSCPVVSPGCLPDDQGLDRGGVGIVQAGQFVGDDLGAAFVDQPGCQAPRGSAAAGPGPGPVPPAARRCGGSASARPRPHHRHDQTAASPRSCARPPHAGPPAGRWRRASATPTRTPAAPRPAAPRSADHHPAAPDPHDRPDRAASPAPGQELARPPSGPGRTPPPRAGRPRPGPSHPRRDDDPGPRVHGQPGPSPPGPSHPRRGEDPGRRDCLQDPSRRRPGSCAPRHEHALRVSHPAADRVRPGLQGCIGSAGT